MKMGFRTPSPKRSFSARTTGKINRTIKKATNPLYGKKGMGYINNPKKAVYNKIYNKTTVSAVKPLNTSHTSNELYSLTVVELKNILRANGLKVSGTKTELINRITANSIQTSNTCDNPINKDWSFLCTPHSQEMLSNLPTDDLRHILRADGLKITGTRAELINRIIENSTQSITNTKADTDTDKAVGTLAGCAIGIYCCPLFIIGILLFTIEMYVTSLIFFAIYALIIFATYSIEKK